VANLLPFDLEKALAGEPVVTRLANTPVKGLRDMREFGADPEEAIVGIHQGSAVGWRIDGRFAEDESSLDLFMAAPEPERLVLFHVVCAGSRLSDGYESPKDAKFVHGRSSSDVLKLITEKIDGKWHLVSAEVIRG
jgi:hypothetical protein